MFIKVHAKSAYCFGVRRSHVASAVNIYDILMRHPTGDEAGSNWIRNEATVLTILVRLGATQPTIPNEICNEVAGAPLTDSVHPRSGSRA